MSAHASPSKARFHAIQKANAILDNFEPDEAILADSPSPESVALSTGEEGEALSRTSSEMSIGSSCASASSKTRFLFPKIDTVEGLLPEQVRWFHKEDSDKKWTAFIGYDSLRLECKYREILQRKGADVLNNPDNNASMRSREDDDVTPELIIVRGGIYEVNVTEMKCYPIYWSSKGHVVSVMRGTWFIESTWQPLEEVYAYQIESEHLTQFENERIPDEDEIEPVKGAYPVIHHLKFKEFHVDWNAVNRVFLYSETKSSKFYRAVGNKLGLAKSGTRLHRGYCYDALMDDKPPDITHLVFVVHGIGQKMETGNIVKRCLEIKQGVNKMKEKFFPDIDIDNKRVEFLPVEWRSTLKLDGDTVDSITPNKVRGLRDLLNSSAMDILYYTSPLYRSEITQGLQTELNRLFAMFCARHPYFEASGGKVSVLAHSLGSVITYDIVTGWNPIQLYDQYTSRLMGGSAVVNGQLFVAHGDDDSEECCRKTETTKALVTELENVRKRASDLESEILQIAQTHHLKAPTLKFKLENFFSLGSPLAVFLALRGIRPQSEGGQDQILPNTLCKRLFNIYHPSDPIAYRLEPLILKHYESLMPLRVHRHDAQSKPPYESIPLVAYSAQRSKITSKKELEKKEEDAERSEETEVKEADPKSGEKRWSFSLFSRQRANKEERLSAEMKVLDSHERFAETQQPDDDDWTNLDVRVDRSALGDDYPELEHRLDFQLKEGKMENKYLSAITSHTSYWSSLDVALFLLTQIFPGYGPR